MHLAACPYARHASREQPHFVILHRETVGQTARKFLGNLRQHGLVGAFRQTSVATKHVNELLVVHRSIHKR